MALNPKSKSVLDKFTKVAKAIIYEPKRMMQFIQMLGSPEGAITAVQSVISVMEKKMPVPPDVLPLLGVNIYMAMVDIAQASTDVKADPGVMKKVISAILTKLEGSLQSAKPEQPIPTEQPAQAQPQAKPQGLMASMQGAAA